MTGADLDRTLLALADPTRRRVVDLLRKRPQRAGDLADALSISAPRLSRHLRVLRRSGLIEDAGVEHDARVSLYRLRPERFVTLRSWLDQVEQFWTTELAAFKTHVERTRPPIDPARPSGPSRAPATNDTPKASPARRRS
jgi:DNA-binding transcriptional ArsR family regulator